MNKKTVEIYFSTVFLREAGAATLSLKRGLVIKSYLLRNTNDFEVQDVIAWRGEPKSENEAPVQDELIKTLQKQVAQLESQISTKDEQINRLQDSMRDQTKMLEHHAEREKVQAEQANKSFIKRFFG